MKGFQPSMESEGKNTKEAQIETNVLENIERQCWFERERNEANAK